MATDPHWPTARAWLARADIDPRLVVVGVPTSAGSISASEARSTPGALRRVLQRFATFDGESGIELGDLPVVDHGDWPLTELSAADAVVAIAERVAALGTRPVHAFVGGDNLITYPIAANLPHAPLERTGVLTFDAHHDVRDLTGQPYSNGSPIRLLIEAGLPGTHVAQIGIHSFANSRHYRDWCEARGIGVVTMDAVDHRGIGVVVREALDELADRVDVIHVDLDLDVLDRVHAPGCPGSRPGGMTPRQLAAAARLCGGHPKVVSADLVEVDASRDRDGITVMNLATTLLSFAAGVATRG